MKKITISDNLISVELSGWDMIWSIKKSLNIPLSSVTKVYLRPKEMRPPWLRAPGTYLPGVIIAGTYIGSGRKEFWSSHLKEHSIVIDLINHTYTSVVIDTPNAPELITNIETKITQNKAVESTP